MKNKSIVKNENLITEDLILSLKEIDLDSESEDVIDYYYMVLIDHLDLGDYMERKSVTVKDKRTLSSFPTFLQEVEKYIQTIIGFPDFDIKDVLSFDNTKVTSPRLLEWWKNFFPESIDKLKISDYTDGWSTTVWYEMKNGQDEKTDKKKEYDRQNYLKKKKLNGTKLQKVRNGMKDKKKEYDRQNYLMKKKLKGTK
jgi:hypothetical protein